MKPRWRHSLAAKMLGWLALHLLLLALAFGGFVAWQLRMGLEALLGGGAGQRLRDLGEVVASDLRNAPRETWPDLLAKHTAERGLRIDLFLTPDRWTAEEFTAVPENVMRRIEGMRPPGPPRLHHERGGFPPPPPPPRAEKPIRPAQGEPMRPARPVFLMRGEHGDGYWAGVEIATGPPTEERPARGLLVLRADSITGNSWFFDLRPWIWGGLAVLGLSLVFWLPMVVGITRYLRQLTRATERIAAGDFEVAIDTRRRDDLGRLGVAITDMADRLGRFVGGQRRFLADVAHELCAPLARLRTGIGLLEHGAPPPLLPAVQSVDEEAGELAKLIEEVLAFSRAGARKPDNRDFELAPLLETVIGREAGEMPVELRIPPAFVLHADPAMLQRAFANLVRNARIHAGPAPELSITAERTPEGRAMILFRDQGPGVDATEIPRLFEPFYRPDLSRTRDTGGNGLGLAIVRACIEACGGTVNARLPSGKGLEIVVSLPLAGA